MSQSRASASFDSPVSADTTIRTAPKTHSSLKEVVQKSTHHVDRQAEGLKADDTNKHETIQLQKHAEDAAGDKPAFEAAGPFVHNQLQVLNAAHMLLAKTLNELVYSETERAKSKALGNDLNYMLCVDGSEASARALKHMVKVLHPGDSLVIFHSWWPQDKYLQADQFAELLGINYSDFKARLMKFGGESTHDHDLKIEQRCPSEPDPEPGIINLVLQALNLKENPTEIEFRKNQANLLLLVCKQYLKDQGVASPIRLICEESADPRPLIVSRAKAKNIDTIVMGSHGFGLVKSVLYGSTSSHVVSNSDCPVLIVR